jgi:hypothetical protein
MIVGGLRDRLLKDSFLALVEQGLSTLGWFDPGRAHRPVTLIEMPYRWDEPVAPNAVAVDFSSSEISEWEVGSRLTQDVHLAYVEIFTENDSLGTHISNDIRDWLRGRLQAPLAGVTFPIFDYRQAATPPVIGYMTLDRVTALRNTQATENVWLRHWFRVRCEIHDIYAGGAIPAPYPGPDLYPAAVLYPGA